METCRMIAGHELRGFAERALVATGVSAPKASLVAESLIAANLRGVDTHGVMLLPYYVEQISCGNIDPQSDGRVVSESGGCLLYDGQNGIGQHISNNCCTHVVRLARQHGIAMVVARNSNHFGAAAFWGKRISAAGMIGIVMSNASPSVAPWQGREGRIGTNPLCVSLPSVLSGEWLLDMATTTVAKNRIVKAASGRQSTIPAGWAMDSDGVPTQDTEKALRGLLMPLGGYKGSGLGMMAEILCAALSGGAQSTDVGGLHSTDKRMNTSHSFLAVEVSRYLPLQLFQSRMEQLISRVKSSLPAQGYDEILVAGDPESRMEARRLREGIPIEANIWKNLTDLAQKLGCTGPHEI